MVPSILHHHLLLLLLLLAVRAHGSTFGFDLHHRFSDKLRNWAQSLSLETVDWPEKGTPEYYAALVAHDRALLHGRRLADSMPDLTFADGNETVKIRAFGSLYYAEVRLGMPNVTLLVALDTGSNLMWVPCDCKNCVPTSNFSYPFNSFNSSASSTNKRVLCSSILCGSQNSCLKPTDTCPYRVTYVDNTTTSGVLLEDVLHLITDDSQQKAVEARVTFGCGQDQANTKIPTGLLGLGKSKISVPTTLAEGGFTANSFSMCFSDDGTGRISFGDRGSPNQDTTPINSTIRIYAVTVTDVHVGGDSINTGFPAYFDTGSSFTILEDPAYTAITETFNTLVQRRRYSGSTKLPFRFCYEVGSNETQVLVPRITLVMKGGKEFNLIRPEIFLGDPDTRQVVAFCLAIIKSSRINIIGQNFMTGYKVVFNSGSNLIGWTEFDCYNNVALNASFPTLAPASAPTPAPAPVPPPHTYTVRPLQETPILPSGSTSPSSSKGASAPPLLKQSLLLSLILSQLFLFLLFTF